jgi:AhpD family alkylhydroperoxidase
VHRDSGHLPGCPFGNLIVETATYSPGMRQAIKRHLERITGHFQRCLQDAVERGELPAQTDTRADAERWLALMEGILVMAKVDQNPDTILRLGPSLHLLLGVPDPICADHWSTTLIDRDPKRRSTAMQHADFPLHDRDSAPDAAAAFDSAQSTFGMIPNLTRKMATSPALAQAYLDLTGLFEGCSLSAPERGVILLTVSRFHGCDYCMAAHSVTGRMTGLPDAEVDALREDRPLADAAPGGPAPVRRRRCWRSAAGSSAAIFPRSGTPGSASNRCWT